MLSFARSWTPFTTAGAEPSFILARRTDAESAADARAGRVVAFVLSGLAVDCCGSVTHAQILSRTLSAYVREKGSGSGSGYILDTLFAEFRLHQG